VFRHYCIKIDSPERSQYAELRYFIEAVKQNAVDEKARKKFHEFVSDVNDDAVILGCTELPIIYRECLNYGLAFTKKIYDPLQSAINVLAKLYKS
ncbi:MAG: aspartate/glutamate racemase family protein, partial [Synergistaceae bacterium]|nr:aspartate/glutamate racemase family protein [Synergistaceae bacterium]